MYHNLDNFSRSNSRKIHFQIKLVQKHGLYTAIWFFQFFSILKIWHKTHIFTRVMWYKDRSIIYWYEVPISSWKSNTCKNGLLTHFLEDICIMWEHCTLIMCLKIPFRGLATSCDIILFLHLNMFCVDLSVASSLKNFTINKALTVKIWM